MRTKMGVIAALLTAAIIGLATIGSTSAQESAPNGGQSDVMDAATECVAPDGTENGGARTTADVSRASYDSATRRVSYGDAVIEFNHIPDEADPGARYVSSPFIAGSETIRIVASHNAGVLGIIANRAVTDCGANVWPRYRWYVSNFVENPQPATSEDSDDSMMSDDDLSDG